MRIQPSLLFLGTIAASLVGCRSQSPSATPAASQPTTIAAAPATAPASQPAVVTLRFTAASIDAIEAGTKTSTTRKGVRRFPGDVALASDGERSVNLMIVSALPKKLSQLTESDARSDGSESSDAMRETLEKNYAGISEDDVVTVVTFRMAK